MPLDMMRQTINDGTFRFLCLQLLVLEQSWSIKGTKEDRGVLLKGVSFRVGKNGGVYVVNNCVSRVLFFIPVN